MLLTPDPDHPGLYLIVEAGGPVVDLDAVKEYLTGSGSNYTDDEIVTALASEQAAQAHVCTIPDPMPADLQTALCRRVARALQMRQLPLGYQLTADGGSRWASAHDSEIKRLEAPYRKRAVR